MIWANQSGTKTGAIPVTAGEDLTGKEGYLAVVTNASTAAVAKLISASDKYPTHVIVEGAASGAQCTLLPLTSGQQVRVIAAGSGNPGTALYGLISTGTAGASVAAEAAGTYYVCLKAEEAWVAGQAVLCRAYPPVTSTTVSE